ncbi:MAG: hypothetical protein KAT04_08160 [Methylococcales bacterium]|nr:hypothetical protein [Methylococcales bacterium]
MLTLFMFVVLILGPLTYLLFFAEDIFDYSKSTALLYIVGLAVGFTLWKPLVPITLAIAWCFVIGSWAWIVWKMLRNK